MTERIQGVDSKVFFQDNPLESLPLSASVSDYSASIAKTRTLEEGGKQYTGYFLEVSDGADRWTLIKRFSQFEVLARALSDKYTIAFPEFPQKKWFGNLDEAFVSERKKMLQTWLDSLLENPQLTHSYEVKAFLSPTPYPGATQLVHPDKVGFLLDRESWSTSWTKSWAAISDGCLHLFDSRSSTEPRLMFFLPECGIAVPRDKVDNRSVILLSTPDPEPNHFLVPPAEKELAIWVLALRASKKVQQDRLLAAAANPVQSGKGSGRKGKAKGKAGQSSYHLIGHGGSVTLAAATKQAGETAPTAPSFVTSKHASLNPGKGVDPDLDRARERLEIQKGSAPDTTTRDFLSRASMIPFGVLPMHSSSMIVAPPQPGQGGAGGSSTARVVPLKQEGGFGTSDTLASVSDPFVPESVPQAFSPDVAVATATPLGGENAGSSKAQTRGSGEATRKLGSTVKQATPTLAQLVNEASQALVRSVATHSQGTSDARKTPLTEEEYKQEEARMHTILRNGATFTKYGRKGFPHKRFVWCSQSLEDLHWGDAKSPKDPSGTLAIASITNVMPGATTDVFTGPNKLKGRIDPSRAFSILSPGRSLDLVAETPEQRDLWVLAFRFLMGQYSLAIIKLEVAGRGLSDIPHEVLLYRNVVRFLNLEDNAFRVWGSLLRMEALTALHLGSNILGDIPPDVARLRNLKTLNVSKNVISWVAPNLKDLRALRTLDLSDNFVHTLPPLDLPALKTLRLSGNLLTTLPTMAKVPALANLEVAHNHLTNIPPTLKGAAALRNLDLSHNEIVDMTDLRTFHNLVSLRLSHNNLTKLTKEIGKLPALVELDISHNALTAITARIAMCTSLASLDASHNKLTGLPEDLGTLGASMWTLHLEHNALEIVPVELNGLTNLRELYIGDNNFRGLPKGIGGMASLEILSSPNNPRLESISGDSFRGLTSLRELYLEKCPLLSKLPVEFANLGSLVEMKIDTRRMVMPPTKVVSKGPAAIRAFFESGGGGKKGSDRKKTGGSPRHRAGSQKRTGGTGSSRRRTTGSARKRKSSRGSRGSRGKA